MNTRVCDCINEINKSLPVWRKFKRCIKGMRRKIKAVRNQLLTKTDLTRKHILEIAILMNYFEKRLGSEVQAVRTTWKTFRDCALKVGKCHTMYRIVV